MTRTANEFLTPQAIKVEAVSGTSAKVILEPLERGFGHTLGNALRRILLSSMPGCAIVEVEMDGVLHEFSTIAGIHSLLFFCVSVKDGIPANSIGVYLSKYVPVGKGNYLFKGFNSFKYFFYNYKRRSIYYSQIIQRSHND